MSEEESPTITKVENEHTAEGSPTKSKKLKNRSYKNNKAPERWISILGFVIVTKADVLAAAAFLLSLSSVFFELTSWIIGPKPSIYSPDVVYIFFDRYANNKTLLRFAADVTFVNTASPGHDAIVRDITLSVSGNNFSNSQDWLSFISLRRNGTNLELIPSDTAHPFPLTAGSAVSYMVSFAPREMACEGMPKKTSIATCNTEVNFLSDTDFLNRISKISTLRVDFTASLVGSTKILLASCVIPINLGLEEYLAENQWFSAECFSD